MTRLIFVEGVSGTGKSTTTKMLARELEAKGLRVKMYEEFDHTNPIDFYSTAYLDAREYAEICIRFPDMRRRIHENTVRAGEAFLVRYCAGNTRLFEDALASFLEEREFCYKPRRLVPIEGYTAAYTHVWRDFAAELNNEWDVILFDGSLIHHPVNDLIRNYDVEADRALHHVRSLIKALGKTEKMIYYLMTDDVAKQLARARECRGQERPTKAQTSFWQKRFEYDIYVLKNLGVDHRVFDVSGGGWEAARQIMEKDTKKERR